MKHIVIPSHWTPAQAEAVWDFIADLLNAVWDAYELPLVDAAIRELNAQRHNEVADRENYSDIPP